MAKTSNNNDTGILREIDEELRQEHYEKLWKRYGTYLIAAAVLLVVGVAGYKGWQAYDLNQRSNAATSFYAATTLIDQGNTAEAFNAFNLISIDSPDGYKILARFRVAGVLVEQNDNQAASLAYQEIAADSSVIKELRDLATLLEVINTIDTGSIEAMSAKITPLTVISSPWHFSALEISAILSIRSGDINTAIETLTQLSSDPASPAGIKSRSNEILASLNAQ